MNSTRGKLVFVLAIMIVVVPVLFACTTSYPLPTKPEIEVTFPNGGEEVTPQDGLMAVRWTSTNIPASEIVVIQVSSDSGTTWRTVNHHTNDGLALCLPPAQPTTDGRVKVCCFVEGVGVVSDTSDGDFSTNLGGFSSGSYDYYAEYYDCGLFSSTPPDDIFTNPPAAPVTCIEGGIAHDWGDGAPESGAGVIQSDFFAARWRGIFHFSEGSYNFATTADDGVRVYLDGELIINEWGPHVVETYEAEKHVEAGDHQVKVEYFERMGVATCAVSWKGQLEVFWTDSNWVAWSSPRRVTYNTSTDDRPSIVEFATWGLLGKYVFWHSWRPVSGADQSYPDLWQNLSLDQYGASWSDASLLTAEGDNYRPAPARINGQGGWPSGVRSLWVVWASNRPGPAGYNIYYKYLYESSTYVWEWSDDIALDEASSGMDQDPSIIQTQDGTIWIAWCSHVAGDYDIYLACSYNGGVTWVSCPDIPELDCGGDEMYPTMAEIGEYICVAFHSNKDGDNEIYYVRFDPISYEWVWGSLTQLTENTGIPDQHPTILQTKDGEKWIAWDRLTAANDYEVYYRRSTDCGATWSTEVDITNNSHVDQTPWLTQTVDGKIWMVWATDRDGNLEIYAMYGWPLI